MSDGDMLHRDNKRQASVGEQDLFAPPDHQRHDSGRPGARPESSTNASSSEPVVRFSSGVRPGLYGRHSLRNLSKGSGLGSRLSAQSEHMDVSSFEGFGSLGATAAFKSPAAARRFLNQSRRSDLREKLISSQSARFTGSERLFHIPSESELAPLVDRVGNGGTDGGTTSENNGTPADGLPEYDTVAALKSIVFGKPVSVLLLFIPVAIWSAKAGWGANYVFWLNFLVMIPLASILGDFTEEAALHTNDTVGGLLNATFGNAVEVVVAIQALLANEIRVVQASMIGSIFSNLLLVLGCCFFFGGLYYKEQSFNSTSATANMGLLALSSIAMVLPTPFAEYYNIQDEHVLIISRFAAIFLLFMYIQLLIFQLHTHKDLFDDDELTGMKISGETDDGVEIEEEEVEEEEEASISMAVALTGLGVTTLAVTLFSDYLVSSIDEFCEVSGISRTFVGLIILPIVGNAVEHITAVTVAMKNKMDLSMGVAVGSCTQISLFVVPLTVLVGWALDKPMTLNFPHFEITLYILSVFTVSVCVSNPKGNWLEGSLLITTYIMIAIGFWFEKVIDFR